MVYEDINITNDITIPIKYNHIISSNNENIEINISDGNLIRGPYGIMLKLFITSLPNLPDISGINYNIDETNIVTSNFLIPDDILIGGTSFTFYHDITHTFLYRYLSSYSCNINIPEVYYDIQSDCTYVNNLIHLYLNDIIECDFYEEYTTSNFIEIPITSYTAEQLCVITSNVIHYNKYNIYDMNIQITTERTLPYISDISAPGVILSHDPVHLYTLSNVEFAYLNEITINSIIDFVNPDPLNNLNVWYDRKDNIDNAIMASHTYYDELQAFGETFYFNITLNDRYTIYNFSRPEFIQPYDFNILYTAITTEQYKPHITMQNNVNFTETGEDSYGFINKLYSRDGDFHIVSEDKTVTRHSLDISKSGDLKIYGNINATQENSGILHVNKMILNGDILDRLGNSMLFNYSEDMYDRAFVMQSSNYILYTSNYNIHSTSTLDFTLEGKSQNGVIITKEDISEPYYDLFKINEQNISRLTIMKGGNIGIMKEPDPNFDIDIKHNLRDQ